MRNNTRRMHRVEDTSLSVTPHGSVGTNRPFVLLSKRTPNATLDAINRVLTDVEKGVEWACRAAALPQPCSKTTNVAAIISQPYTRKRNNFMHFGCDLSRPYIAYMPHLFPPLHIGEGQGVRSNALNADARGASIHPQTQQIHSFRLR